MDTMKWFFHNDIQGTHLLFETFQLENGWNLLASYIFIVFLCWSERGLTYYLDQLEYNNTRSRWRKIITRTLLYGLVTVFRLWYMLITMYFNIGLFIMVVVSLCSGQLVIEVLKSSTNTRYANYDQPQYENQKHLGNSFEEEGEHDNLDRPLPETPSFEYTASTASLHPK
ncbi:uncharacterized protein BX664DRAFT_352126 [Halteromyces radiatus]|uniref:uncharacterized protein n=1 Tax=Halteromyces radiatus TaxID=101107 RepID=UPI00221ED076|nr:uncharacterized protein BX664DRAFT_352126 [Halteromyces radiatus]KAI8082859.1 hypothetical protein BX664DRAFT_352126 [Halteromyces radiatus]